MASNAALKTSYEVPQTLLPLWSHQRETVMRALQYDGFMAALDMGAGKSAVGVAVWLAMRARYTLICCPKSVGAVWPRQFELFSPVKARILDLTDDRPVKRRAKELVEALKLVDLTREPLVVIINYDSVWRDPLGPTYDKRNRIAQPGIIMSRQWDLVIYDESHRLKTPSGRASKFATRLRHRAARVLCLTGTPMPHSPLDIYAQFRAMSPEIFGTLYTSFRSRYAVMGGYEGKQVIGFRDLDVLHDKLYSRAYRVETKDVVDLPDAFHEVRSCKLCPEAMRVYRALENEMVAQIEAGEITASNALVKLLRLQQICSGHVSTDKQATQWLDHGKARLLADLFDDMPRNEPIVVFCTFRADLDKVREVAERMIADPMDERKRIIDRPYAELSGRANELIKWQASGANVLGVQIQAGGLGVDLTRAHYCVYYSTGFNLGNHLQSQARILRPGQKRTVYYYYLQAERTVDQKVYRALQQKKDVVESVLRDMVSQ